MLRWVFRLIDISISSGAVAVISIIASKRMQRLGDMAAGTTVIKLEKAVTLKQISEFETPEEYQVVFQQAALLSDKDHQGCTAGSIQKQHLRLTSPPHEKD